MKLEQWVNLDKNLAQENADPSKPLVLARLGRGAHIRIKFREDHGAYAKYRVVATDAVDSIYKNGKERKYGPFRLYNGRSSVATGVGETTVTQACSLPAMGGNEYKVEAKYEDASGNETVKTSQSFLTGRRRVYCVPVLMETYSTATATFPAAFAALQTSLWSTDELFIDVRKIEPAVSAKLKRRAVPNESLPLSFFDALRPYLAPLKKCTPGFGLVWADQIGRKVAREECFLFDVATSTPGGQYGYDATNETITLTLKDPLWHGFAAEEDLDKHWLSFVDVTTFDDVGADLPDFTLPRDAVDIDGDKSGSDGGYTKIKIDLKRALDARKAIYTRGGQFKVTWELRYATKFLWGVKYGQGNVVAVATRSSWTPIPPADVIATMLHEVAHRLGMVPDGKDPSFLKRNPNEDSEKGDPSKGGHCKIPKCVMLGEGSAPNKFCHNCYADLRRTDLSLGSQVYGNPVT